ncbi:MAG: 3-deoxy-D-manno-octulosonic acid transferase [Nitrospirae bacterium]|nr:3-deoxy-D-manno-octulosonic acid transferase [Nitrospirota bacterium]MBI3593574.1 3-deoxy-D-manno-octulosonic acid transferase [Nitrospirota bacterium]
MATLFYNCILILLFPFFVIWWMLSFTNSKYRTGWKERLGFLPVELTSSLKDRSVFWIHTVSVGEGNAAVPLLLRLKAKYPDKKLVVSTVTVTGQKNIRAKMKGIDGLFYFPFDFPWIVNRVIDHIHPELFIFFETEIWPNLLNRLRNKNVQSVLVNGRISDQSFGRYLKIRSLMSVWLGSISIALMQTEEDRKKFLALGGQPSSTHTTGNTKYDQIIRPNRIPFQEYPLLSRWDWWIAGSTHSKEEEMILKAYVLVRKRFPRLGLILAPRHPDRWNEVTGLLNRTGIRFLKRTGLSQNPEWKQEDAPVILLDTIGELSDWYYWAAIAFVGGSLVPKGGHNILETAIWGKAPFFGKHMHNFREIAELFKSKGAGIEIAGEEDLAIQISYYLENRSLLEEKGKNAVELLYEKQGASEKNLEFISKLIH